MGSGAVVAVANDEGRTVGMAELTTKGKRPRAVWFDPRFAIGLSLVFVSVAGVWWLVSATDHTVAVYAARSTLVAGEAAAVSELRLVHVTLGGAERAYLAADDVPEGGVVLTRTVQEGELVPRSAVTESSGIGVASVVVDVGSAVPASIGAGSVVDLWSAAPGQSGEFEPPAVLVAGVSVVGTMADDGLIVRGDGVRVEVSVPRSQVAAVLAAVAAGHLVSLVSAEPGS